MRDDALQGAAAKSARARRLASQGRIPRPVQNVTMDDPAESDDPPLHDPQINLLKERIMGLRHHRPDAVSEIARAEAELRRRVTESGESADWGD